MPIHAATPSTTTAQFSSTPICSVSPPLIPTTRQAKKAAEQPNPAYAASRIPAPVSPGVRRARRSSAHAASPISGPNSRTTTRSTSTA